MDRIVYIWSFPIRIFHALLILLIVGLFYTSYNENMLVFHISLGMSLSVLIMFRILWGYLGSRYDRFENFDFDLGSLRSYFSASAHNEKIAGHNVASSYMTILMLIILSIIILSGIVVYGVTEARGLLAWLNSVYYKNMIEVQSFHEISAYILMFLIFTHIAGVLIHTKKTSRYTVTSIFTGYKKNVYGVNTVLPIPKKIVAILFFIIAIIVYDQTYKTEIGDRLPIVYNNQDFVTECKRCHMLYPPYLLNKESSLKMMRELDDHFGDDASLSPIKHASIKKFLFTHSSEYYSLEAAFKIDRSMGSNEYLAITETPFWKDVHAEIDDNVFKRDKIDAKANCIACHKDIKYGFIDDKNIKIPK